MGNWKVLVVVSGIWLALLLTGCSSSSSSSSTVANTVTLSPSGAQSVDEGQSLNISATVANDTNNAGVTWTVSGGGSLTNVTTTSVTYTAPTNLLADTYASVTATSVANSAYTGSLPITIVSGLTITTASLVAGNQNSSYFATVTASGGVVPLSWSISSGALPAGLALGTSTTDTNTIQGTPTTQGTSTFTLKVTDADGNVATQTLTLSVDAPLVLAITTNALPGGMVGTSYSQNLTAKNGLAPYTWSLVSGSNLPPGLTLNPTTGTVSGVPTAPGTYSFSVQVNDSSIPPQSVTADLAITINAAVTSGSGLNGNYVFLLNGFDSSGLFAAAGTLTADGNGTISGGTADLNNPSGPQTNQVLGASTYSVASDSLGTMTIAFPSGTRTFAFSLMADGNANLIEFDGIAQASGTLAKQTATNFSAGDIRNAFAFGFIGADAHGGRFGMAGAFMADGVSALTDGILDSDDGGVSANPTFSGTYTVADTGRGTAALAIPGQGTLNFAFYVVSDGQLVAVETDSVGAGSPLLSGNILQQSTVGSGSLTATVFEVSALGTSNSPEAQVGQAVWGSPNVTITSDQNDAGTLTSELTQSGTFVVNSQNGRTTLANSNSQGSLFLPATGSSSPVLYLVAPNQGFIIGTDSGVTFGTFVAQSGIFNTASLSGTYAGGSLTPVSSSVLDEEVGQATADGAGNLTLVYDQASGLIQNQSILDTYSIQSNGRAVLSSNGSTSDILYMASPTQFFELGTSTNALIGLFQH